MKRCGWVVLVVLLLFHRNVDAGVGDPIENLPAGRTVFFAAELGTTNDILGLGFSKDLRSMDANGEQHRVFPEEFVEVPVNQYDVTFELVDNALSFEAHGRYLFFKAGVRKSKHKRYMVVRVSQIDKVVKLKPTGRPLASAPLYASKIFYGWSLYIVIEGDAATFTSDVAAGLMAVGAKLSVAMESNRLTSHVHAIGLRPKNDGEVVIATNALEVQEAFYSAGEPQPIYVEYTVLQDVPVEAIPWAKNELRPGRYQIDVDLTVMLTKSNGRPWDGGGNPPDPLVALVVDGAKVSSCKTQDSYDSSCIRDIVIDIDNGTTISLSVIDKDLSSDDYVGGTEVLTIMESRGVPGEPIHLKPTGQVKAATVTLTQLNTVGSASPPRPSTSQPRTPPPATSPPRTEPSSPSTSTADGTYEINWARKSANKCRAETPRGKVLAVRQDGDQVTVDIIVMNRTMRLRGAISKQGMMNAVGETETPSGLLRVRLEGTILGGNLRGELGIVIDKVCHSKFTVTGARAQ